MSTYEKLNDELKKAGVPVQKFMGEKQTPIDTLVNTRTSSKPYNHILLKYFTLLSGNEKEMLIRALTEKDNKQAVPFLLEILDNPAHHSQATLWAAGNALNVIDDKESYPAIITFCQNNQLGIARQMLLEILAKIKTEESFQTLLNCLGDPQIRGHAIEALGKFGDPRAIDILNQVEVDKRRFEYKAKLDALNQLSKKKI